MSDERVDADAGTDTEEGRGGRTAVVTRPQRPTGKRSRGRAEASEAVELGKDGADTKVKTAKKAAGPSRNPFAFVFTYLKQVVAELRKVIWPNRKQMMTYTSVVLAFLAFMVALIGLADFGLAKLVLLVFG
ncbi:MAG TPA: preprotein translocase subunit SecE [Mycobacterium sp.]|uniref:preprotein translocase subunit SecE n=1 Tax=Mycobacterium sp. TaxID=1785 RepID=UPI002D62E872|nr:preprotein translocase subunit SecE [Mycobacterium sp.]HZU50109.1 preprotein translocase subunit SecE [Mycobacterium sp.]